MKTWIQNSERVKVFLTMALIILCVYLGFRYFLPLIFPFVVAYFITWMVRPVTEFLVRKLKMPRLLAGTISLTLLFAILTIGICILCKLLIEQAIAFLRNVPVYVELITDKMFHLCKGCDELLGLKQGTLMSIVEENVARTMNRITSNIMPSITEHTLTIMINFVGFTGLVLITFIAAILIIKDLPSFQARYEGYSLYQDIHKVTVKLAEVGIAYLRTQVIIMLITAFFSVLALTIIKNEYSLLLGVGIAILDALPILGSGLIYIPWGIILLINGDIFPAAVLITTYLICQIIREILEPKLIGNQIGIKPLFTLISMYAGVKLFSVAGFFFGPVGLVIIITIWKVLHEKEEEASIQQSQDITYSGD